MMMWASVAALPRGATRKQPIKVDAGAKWLTTLQLHWAAQLAVEIVINHQRIAADAWMTETCMHAVPPPPFHVIHSVPQGLL